MAYHQRIIETTLKKYLEIFSAVGILGPRQSGKSTLLLHTLPDYEYITFDDHKIVSLFYDDPDRFMRTYSDRVIFDEAQKVPELFDMIKLNIDRDRGNKGKFIVTSSSQFAFHKNITESLAGRIGLLTLLPYQFSEIPSHYQQISLFRGSYPELTNNKYQLTEDWYGAYMDTYINRDVRSLANIGDMRDFQHLLQLLAANTSQLLNMSRFANDIGVDVKTIKRWISILEASYIIFILPPFYENFGKRITKSPKVYFYDTGLVSYLTGIQNFSQYDRGPMAGSLFENYIVAEIMKRECHNKTHATLYFYRSSSGQEIDLIIDRKNHREFIEIKKTETFKPAMLKPIETLISATDTGLLIYNGADLPELDNLRVINYKTFLE
jgi:hypothetical protein